MSALMYLYMHSMLTLIDKYIIMNYYRGGIRDPQYTEIHLFGSCFLFKLGKKFLPWTDLPQHFFFN